MYISERMEDEIGERNDDRRARVADKVEFMEARVSQTIIR